jgi:hypothetical protein
MPLSTQTPLSTRILLLTRISHLTRIPSWTLYPCWTPTHYELDLRPRQAQLCYCVGAALWKKIVRILGQKVGKYVFLRLVTSQLEIVWIDLFKIPGISTWTYVKLAPVPFLYPQGLLLYGLSNTGKDLKNTLYKGEQETKTFKAALCTNDTDTDTRK